MEYMLEKYQGNLANMFIVLAYYENKKEIGIFRRKAEELRSRLALLSKAIEKTQMIARTNIRLKNIKTTLRLLNKIPNVTKMKLAELKQINLKTL